MQGRNCRPSFPASTHRPPLSLSLCRSLSLSFHVSNHFPTSFDGMVCSKRQLVVVHNVEVPIRVSDAPPWLLHSVSPILVRHLISMITVVVAFFLLLLLLSSSSSSTTIPPASLKNDSIVPPRHSVVPSMLVGVYYHHHHHAVGTRMMVNNNYPHHHHHHHPPFHFHSYFHVS